MGVTILWVTICINIFTTSQFYSMSTRGYSGSNGHTIKQTISTWPHLTIWHNPQCITSVHTILVSSYSFLCAIYWSQVLSRERRCSRNSVDKRRLNYIWVINDFIACYGAIYIRGSTVGWYSTTQWLIISPRVLVHLDDTTFANICIDPFIPELVSFTLELYEMQRNSPDNHGNSKIVVSISHIAIYSGEG